MPRPNPSGSIPRWDDLHQLTDAQGGYFTTAEAKAHAISPELLNYYVREGILERPWRGVYRFADSPAGEWDLLVVYWLWSKRQGVFSHATALRLHNLVDLDQDSFCMTVPLSWAQRRLHVPEGVHLHYGSLPRSAIERIEGVPVTRPLRTILDCSEDDSAEWYTKIALRMALDRGLFTRARYNAAKREHVISGA